LVNIAVVAAAFCAGKREHMRRTKIIATIGPKSSTADTIQKMIDAGTDAARLNFSHGTHAEHRQRSRVIRRLSAKNGKAIGIIADLQGPKIRTGELDSPVELNKGDDLIVTTRKVKSAGNRISTLYGRLHRDVSPGDRILFRDGSMAVEVARIEDRDIHCRVVFGGTLTSHTGMNVPGVEISEPSLTRKDRDDVKLAVELGVDYLAISFVRSPDDVSKLKRLLKKHGADIHIIAKIERPEALDRLDEIIAAADGIMIARGDLGVEMPPEKVPRIQKDIIDRCAKAGKPVITATQMLESMTTDPTPTRAEVSDVFNAIYDGTDAVMLSGETAVGSNPVRVVKMMERIAAEADSNKAKSMAERGKTTFRRVGMARSFEAAIGRATEIAARNLQARLIVCFTSSGYTALQASSYRPDTPIVGATQHQEILPRMSLYWGVQPILTPTAKTVDEMIENVERELSRRRLVRKGDSIIITAGYPLGVSGTTNMMQLVRIGEQPAKPDAKSGRGKRGQ
jgi:pyruvate kinase